MNDKNITYEVCPHCTHEVELPNTLGVHKCPHCGKYIVACSMCLALGDNKADCKNCPLCYLADKMNNEQFGGDLEKATNELYNLIGDNFAPLDEIEYAGVNGVGRALSIHFIDKYTHSVEIGYDVNGFLFTETRNMSELIYTDFIDYVMANIKDSNESYAYLYNRAYQPTSRADGESARVLYVDEKDNVPYHSCGIILKVIFQKNIEMGTDVKIVYKNGFGNPIMVDTCLGSLPIKVINTLKEISNRKEKHFTFHGTTTIKVNSVVGIGRTEAEAIRNAQEQIDDGLTLYGFLDTQVDDFDNIDIH